MATRVVVLVLVVAIGCTGPDAPAGRSPAAPAVADSRPPAELAGFADDVDSVRAAWGIPGMAVAVVRDGELMFAQAFGLRDVERGLPVTPRTVFALGSASKAFTALALLLLAEDGLLDLDAPLVEAVPDFRLNDERATRRATARDLLAHRAGLPSQYDMLWLLAPISRGELFTRLRFLEPTAELGERFQYSNVGYIAAGVVLERLSGVSWEDFLETRVFRPLGMERTGFVEPVEPPAEDQALPYRVSDATAARVPFAGSVAFENATFLGPAGSVSSTVEDMARWMLMHLAEGRVADDRLVSKTALRQLFEKEIAISDPGYRMLTQADAYGLGWALSDHRGHRVLHHGGNIEGYSSLVSLMPEIESGVVVLSNSMDLAGYEITRNAFDRLLGLEPLAEGGELKALFATLDQARAEARRPPVSDPEASASRGLASYAGVYDNPVFGRATVSAGPGSLALTFGSGVRATLHHSSLDAFKGITDEFYLPAFEVSFEPAAEDTTAGFGLVLSPGGPEIRFTKRP